MSPATVSRIGHQQQQVTLRSCGSLVLSTLLDEFKRRTSTWILPRKLVLVVASGVEGSQVRLNAREQQR